MSKVVYLRPKSPVSENYVIECKAENSWWVTCQPLAWDGTPLPTARVVFFARTEKEARAWVDSLDGAAAMAVRKLG